jgi:hypothetical protein
MQGLDPPDRYATLLLSANAISTATSSLTTRRGPFARSPTSTSLSRSRPSSLPRLLSRHFCGRGPSSASGPKGHPARASFGYEVDAPLDEANIDRFTTLLSELSDETQFVLITHSKRTMETAQAHYGVTQEEPGVSKIVSVRFG